MGTVLPWRARSASSQKRLEVTQLLGEYSGRARFVPRYPAMIPRELEQAIGQTVEVCYAGTGPSDGPFPGQELYCEWRRDDVLSGHSIPAKDLEFLDAPRANVADALVRAVEDAPDPD